MNVGTWFRRRMAMPFLALGTAFLAACVALALVTLQARQRSTQQARERFEHVASIALQQRNRPLLETALASLRSETGSTDVAMCEGGRVLLALPSRQNACRPQPVSPWTSVQKVTLPAFTAGEVLLRSSRWPHFSFIATLAALGLLLVVGVVEVVRRAAKEFARELVHPLVTRAYDFDLCEAQAAPVSCIRELNALVDAHRKSIADVKRLVQEVAAHAATAAIARTTQALAHDVRKPFSMFKSIIHIVEGTEDPNEVREVLKVTLPEVNQAMASVEGMLQDVMHIGSEAKLYLEDAAPEALVEAALGDLFRVYAHADVSLGYSFAHRNMVRVDSLRLGRVFANILGNAVQAMHEKGRLWIRTVEHDGFVEFTIGNAGSVIPAESLPKLFDAFFTLGKKGGTGLGLAIAKKIVEAHGGTIRCVSETNDRHPGGMVEFVFTLPASSAVCAPRFDALPKCSQDIQSAFAAVRIAELRQAGARPDSHEAEIEAILVARLEALCSSNKDSASALPTVLVVDDEAVYRNGLHSLVDRSEALAGRIRMVFARNAVEAFAAVKEHSPVLLIEDVDLGPHSKCGLDIVRSLREVEFAGHICVHSNRFLAGEAQAALAAGADTVLPKPMGRAHLLKLILASLPESETTVAASAHAPTASSPKLSVAFLDDSLSFRLAWKMKLEEQTRFRAFASTTAFFDTCERESSFLASLDVVVTDYNFAPSDPHDGGTFARELRNRGYGGLLLRASGETELGPEIEVLFQGDVGKGALEWAEFQQAVEEARSVK
ncbi:MAG: response regulator [Silvanigrellales bacterium]|nr:response regulator [Silvanigrellales bacterium]